MQVTAVYIFADTQAQIALVLELTESSRPIDNRAQIEGPVVSADAHLQSYAPTVR